MIVPADSVPVDERAQMVEWMRNRIADIQADAEARVERAKVVPEHPWAPLGQLVQHYAGMQQDPATIAKLLDIPYSTLMLYYENDLAIGAASINLKIAENMARIATSTLDKDAAKVGMQWLERTNPRFKASKKLEIEDQREQRVIDSSKLTPEQRQQLRDMIDTASRVDGEGEDDSNSSDRPGAGSGLIIGS
jgi:hypothetical protein